MTPVPPSPFRFIYQDESGDVCRSRCHFIVGLLLVREPEPLRAAVAKVRADFHFKNELHFVKTSALRERVYRATFEGLATVVGEFEFHAILVRREFLDLGWFGGRRHLAYNFFTKLLLQQHAPRIHSATMYADAKARLREDNFLSYLPSELNLQASRYVIQHIEALDSKSDDVLQIADLLTGCANVATSQLAEGRKRAIYADAVRTQVFNPAHIWEWQP